ncbi:MAG: DUF2058 domain-containing protein [Pseudomonadota bacterium]
MGNALQDQLLNIGLVDKKKAAQSKKDSYKKNKKNRNKKTPVVDENKLRIQQQMLQKKQQDQLLNQQKQEQANLKAIKAQIKQLIESNSISLQKGKEDGKMVEFNFQDNNLIKQLQVSDKLQKSLVNGSLAIAKWGEKYHLIAKAVAEKVAQRDDSFIILLNTLEDDVEVEDDEYTDYQIPDDLMW